MSDITRAREALEVRILDGDGTASRADRRAAFDNARGATPVHTLIDKVATGAHTITDDDITAVIASGLSEDQIFEIVVCAAVGQARRQHDAAMAALEAAAERSAHATEDSR